MNIIDYKELTPIVKKLKELDDIATSKNIQNIFGSGTISDLMAAYYLQHNFVADHHGPDGTLGTNNFEYKVSSQDKQGKYSWTFNLESPLHIKDKEISKYYFIGRKGTTILDVWECEPSIVHSITNLKREDIIRRNIDQIKWSISANIVTTKLNGKKLRKDS